MAESRRSPRLDRTPGRALVNLAFVGRRLSRPWRAGVPQLAGGRRWLVVVAAALVATALLAVFGDAASVGWAEGLAVGARSAFEVVSDVGRSQWFLVPSGGLVAILLMGRWSAVAPRLQAAWARIGFLSAYVFLAVGVGGVIANVIKQLIGRARPGGFGEVGAYSFDPFNFDYGNASFPSGHSTTAGAVIVAGWLLFPRFRWLFVVGGVAIAASRVVVGAHFPSDVVAGLTLGAVWAWVLARLFAARGLGFLMRPDGSLRVPNTIRRSGRSRGWRALMLAPLQALAGPREPLN